MGRDQNAHARQHDTSDNPEPGKRLRTVRPPVGLAVADQDQAFRLATFRQAHPRVLIGEYVGAWQARWHAGRTEVVITRDLLRDLLDELDGRFGPSG